jgi:hypothetical protein
MGQAVPTHHPPVVLRSHYRQLRALLAVAMIAIVGLAAAVVILANESDEVEGTSATQSIEAIEYGGFNPATGRPESAPLPQQEHPLQSRIGSTRHDGGPEEGTAALTQRSAPATFDPNSIKSAPGVRYDGGPEEGARSTGR